MFFNVLEFFGKLWNAAECFGMFHNVLEHFGTLRNIAEQFRKFSNVSEELICKTVQTSMRSNMVISFQYVDMWPKVT